MTKTNLKRRIVSLVIALVTVLTAIPLFGMTVKAAADNQDMQLPMTAMWQYRQPALLITMAVEQLHWMV